MSCYAGAIHTGLSIKAEVSLTELLGNESLLFARCGTVEFVARMQQPRVVKDSEFLEFHIAGSRLHLFDADTELSLRTTRNDNFNEEERE